MKNKLIIVLILILIILVLAGFFVFVFSDDDKGVQVGNTIEEPELTVEYLYTDYVDMLKRDGVTETYAIISLIETANDGTYDAIIDGKSIVDSPEEPDGYYIADNNTALPIVIDSSTRFIYDDGSKKEIITTDEFVKLHNDGFENGESEKLYAVYTYGTQTLLIAPYVTSGEYDV